MRRALVSTVAVGCAAAAVVPGFAAAPTQAGRSAAIAVTTTLPDGKTLTLDLMAANFSAGPQLIINAAQCDDDGCSSQEYVGTLEDSDLSVDPAQPVARLEATLSGLPLSVRWAPPAGSGFYVGNGDLTGGATSVAGTAFGGDMADVTVRYDGGSCAGTGGVGNGIVVEASAGDSPQTMPLSALTLPVGAQLHC